MRLKRPPPQAGKGKDKGKGKGKGRKQLLPMQAATDTEAEGTEVQKSQSESMGPDSEVESVMSEALKQHPHSNSHPGGHQGSPPEGQTHLLNHLGGFPGRLLLPLLQQVPHLKDYHAR